ncbi:anti-sigma factor [Streptomyces sp. NPDC005805]|uniref:anti-sigma factor n=1 Tax=Streptomyces sp. NPDC005805 TaxID=3157068 RepID=UPI0033C297C3
MAEHLDPGVLADLALADPDTADGPTPWERAHLDACAACRHRLAGLRQVVASARAATLEDLPVAPPPRVWEALSRDIARESAAPPDTPEPGPDPGAHPDTDPVLGGVPGRPPDAAAAIGPYQAPRPGPEPGSTSTSTSASAPDAEPGPAQPLDRVPGLPGPEPARPGPGGGPPEPPSGPGRGPVPDAGPAPTPRAAWRRRPALVLAAVCLVAGAAAGGATVRWVLEDGGGDTVAATGEAHRLAPLVAGPASGTVRMEEGPGADRRMRISVEGLPPTEGYYEVWLMDLTHRRLIAIGVLGPGGTAVLPVPDGVDLAAYPLVDVSAQAYDGDPAHSGRSVVRGPVTG